MSLTAINSTAMAPPIQPRVAMILAAGKGTRMRPLTLTTPKPLLPAAGKPLIEWHIERLVQAGFHTLVINHSWLGEQLERTIGNGSRWNITIHWSAEPKLLETGGGIRNALPMLGNEPFLVVNGDVFTDVDFSSLKVSSGKLAHLVMVPNPEHNPEGDFILRSGILNSVRENKISRGRSCDGSVAGEPFTFSGISILDPRLFANQTATAFPLAPLLKETMAKGQVSGELHTGYWLDVGTPERLKTLEEDLLSNLGNKLQSK